jgi:preprotein translocase subunit SecF
VVTGTYSSVFIAAPIIVDWEKWSQTRKRGVKKTMVKAGAGR